MSKQSQETKLKKMFQICYRKNIKIMKRLQIFLPSIFVQLYLTFVYIAGIRINVVRPNETIKLRYSIFVFLFLVRLWLVFLALS